MMRRGGAIAGAPCNARARGSEYVAPLQVFICYRRTDAQSASRQLAEALKLRFGPEDVFFDTLDITAGEEWREKTRQHVREADVVLAVIGPHWAAAVEDRTRRGLVDRAETRARSSVSDPTPNRRARWRASSPVPRGRAPQHPRRDCASTPAADGAAGGSSADTASAPLSEPTGRRSSLARARPRSCAAVGFGYSIGSSSERSPFARGISTSAGRGRDEPTGRSTRRPGRQVRPEFTS
jgi:hypothetical protein